MASEACLTSPSIREGAGNAGCLLHPRSRVQCGVRCAHEHTGTAGALRHSLRNGLTAYAALSLETNSSCLHPCRLDGSTDSGRIKFATGSLTPATGAGPHGFAVRSARAIPARTEIGHLDSLLFVCKRAKKGRRHFRAATLRAQNNAIKTLDPPARAFDIDPGSDAVESDLLLPDQGTWPLLRQCDMRAVEGTSWSVECIHVAATARWV